MSFWQKILFIPRLIWGGIHLWVDPPRRLRLKVDHDWDKRRAREQAEMERVTGTVPRSARAPGRSARAAHQPPPLKHVHLNHWYRRGGKKHRSDCSVAIDLERRRIDYTYTSNWLLGREHKGSGLIGVAVFSLPFMLPLAPFLWLANRYYGLMERRRGVSRHGWALYRAIRKQLDSATAELLLEALKNDWRHDRRMAQQVTLEEAKSILGRCHLYETTVSDERVKKSRMYAGIKPQSFHWFDGDDQIASGRFHGEYEHHVQVFRTIFENDEADELIGYFRTREVKVYGLRRVKGPDNQD
ncbi:hypothetical protein AMJ57_01145 [Parcubacteria bacterium SG8_24]|nr:MAG: hypothetical protein AMJ57_01145 [Parcubacteria bacterium SG8_24]